MSMNLILNLIKRKMISRKALLSLLSFSMFLCATAQGNTAVETQADTVAADSIRSAKSVINNNEKDYRNVLFLKLNKNKGYHRQAFEREDAYALLEKRVSYFSFNLGFRSNDVENYWFEPIAIVDEVYNRNISVNLSAGYFISNNMAVGVKAGYAFADTRLKLNADLLDIIIDAKDYETNNASSTFSFAGVIKNYVPLDRGHRLFLVSETGLSYSHTSTLSKNVYDLGAKVHKVEKERNTLAIGLSPGFMYFMTKGFAFEFSMNPVIAYYEKVKITNNQVESGKIQNYGLSFKFMPFNIQFGFAYYFGLDYYKNREYVSSLNKR